MLSTCELKSCRSCFARRTSASRSRWLNPGFPAALRNANAASCTPDICTASMDSMMLFDENWSSHAKPSSSGSPELQPSGSPNVRMRADCPMNRFATVGSFTAVNWHMFLSSAAVNSSGVTFRSSAGSLLLQDLPSAGCVAGSLDGVSGACLSTRRRFRRGFRFSARGSSNSRGVSTFAFMLLCSCLGVLSLRKRNKKVVRAGTSFMPFGELLFCIQYLGPRRKTSTDGAANRKSNGTSVSRRPTHPVYAQRARICHSLNTIVVVLCHGEATRRISLLQNEPNSG